MIEGIQEEFHGKWHHSFRSQNSLRVPEGLEDLSIQLVAAWGHLGVTLSRAWALDALQQPFQQGELHQVQQLQQDLLLPNFPHH